MTDTPPSTAATSSGLTERLVGRAHRPAGGRLADPGDASLHGRLLGRERGVGARHEDLAQRVMGERGLQDVVLARLERMQALGGPRQRWLDTPTPEDWIWLVAPDEEDVEPVHPSVRAPSAGTPSRPRSPTRPMARALRRRSTGRPTAGVRRLSQLTQAVQGSAGRLVRRAMLELDALPEDQQEAAAADLEAWLDRIIEPSGAGEGAASALGGPGHRGPAPTSRTRPMDRSGERPGKGYRARAQRLQGQDAPGAVPRAWARQEAAQGQWPRAAYPDVEARPPRGMPGTDDLVGVLGDPGLPVEGELGAQPSSSAHAVPRPGQGAPRTAASAVRPGAEGHGAPKRRRRAAATVSRSDRAEGPLRRAARWADGRDTTPAWRGPGEAAWGGGDGSSEHVSGSGSPASRGARLAERAGDGASGRAQGPLGARETRPWQGDAPVASHLRSDPASVLPGVEARTVTDVGVGGRQGAPPPETRGAGKAVGPAAITHAVRRRQMLEGPDAGPSTPSSRGVHSSGARHASAGAPTRGPGIRDQDPKRGARSATPVRAGEGPTARAMDGAGGVRPGALSPVDATFPAADSPLQAPSTRAIRLLPPPLAHLQPAALALDASVPSEADGGQDAPLRAAPGWSRPRRAAWAAGDRGLQLAGQAAGVAWSPRAAGVSSAAARMAGARTAGESRLPMELLAVGQGERSPPPGMGGGASRISRALAAVPGAVLPRSEVRGSGAAGDAPGAVGTVPGGTAQRQPAVGMEAEEADRSASTQASGPRGVLAALARADDPDAVLSVLMARGAEAARLSGALPTSTRRMLGELRAMKALPDAAATWVQGAVVGRDAMGRPQRAQQAQWAQREEAVRVVRGTERPAGPTQSGMSAEGRKLMQLSQKLTGLVHLVEGERRQDEATRRVRRASEPVAAAPPGGAQDVASASQEESVTLEALQREVMDAVLAELDMLRMRREGGPDVDIWW